MGGNPLEVSTMKIDWIVAIGLFILFVTWAFGYFSGIFAIRKEPLKPIAEAIQDKVVDFLTVDVETVPLLYHSAASIEGKVLYFQFRWPFGKDSTKITSDLYGELPCSFENRTVFFKVNITPGDNFFAMTFRSDGGEQHCDAAFFRENETAVTVFAGERRTLAAQSKINEMLNMSPGEFGENLSIQRDVRVEIGKPAENITFGPAPPPASDVFVKEVISRIEESGEPVNIRVMVW
jgi:hypothetical protein